MGWKQRVTEFRERLIITHAEPYLDAGEEVVYWVRARPAEGRGEGFVYLTPRRCVVHWRSRSDGSGSVRWDEIRSWGVTKETNGGPILGVETSDDALFARLQVETKLAAEDVATFIRRFAELAPTPRTALSKGAHLGGFHPHAELEVKRAKRTIGGHTKRVIVTVIGVVLLLGGVVLSLPLVPGPGFLTILAGLAVLANEYDWAKDLTNWARDKAKEAGRKISKRSKS